MPGVAVGHGWLSDALRSPEPIFITGILSCDGVHDDSIEVVFSLREVRMFDFLPLFSSQSSFGRALAYRFAHIRGQAQSGPSRRLPGAAVLCSRMTPCSSRVT